jgi:Glutamate racemase
MVSQQAAIGVLDSGVGGISTLRTLTRMLPNENFIFTAILLTPPTAKRTPPPCNT